MSFSNLAFLTDATIPAPNLGLGAVLRLMATDNIYVVAGLADANGDSTTPEVSSVRSSTTRSISSTSEVGWTPPQDRIYLDMCI